MVEVHQLVLFGQASGVISVIALGFAGLETIRASRHATDRLLHNLYDDTLNEPIPANMLTLVDSLGGENVSNNAQNSAGS
jgi:hypothetical protein